MIIPPVVFLLGYMLHAVYVGGGAAGSFQDFRPSLHRTVQVQQHRRPFISGGRQYICFRNGAEMDFTYDFPAPQNS